MNITKTRIKTTLTITTSIVELKHNLEAYQREMLSEMVPSTGGAFDSRELTNFAFICMKQEKAFYDLVEHTGTCWVDTPKGTKAWRELVIRLPYIFGLTDSVLTEDVDVVILVLDGVAHDISEVKDSI
jgi:hypothetical protein